MKYENQRPDLADQVKALVQSANSTKTVPHGVKTVQPGEGLQLLSPEGAEIFWDWETANTWDTRIQEGRAAIEQARADLDKAEQDLAAGAVRVDENRALLDALVPRVDSAEATAAQASKDLTAVSGRLDTTSKDLATLQGTVGDVSAKVIASEQKAADALAKAGAAQMSADGKNRITRATSPASQPGSAVGDTHFTMSSMGGGGVVTRQQRWDGSTWQDESLSHQVLASLDLGKATVGELDGGRIKAGSVYADRIVAGMSQNMVPDPGFINTELCATRLSRALSYGDSWRFSDGVLLNEPASGGRTAASNISLSVVPDLYSWSAYPGMKLSISITARVTSGTGGFRWSIRVKYRDGSTTFTAIDAAYTPLSGTWETYSTSYNFPDNVASYSLTLQIDRTSTGVLGFRSPMAAAKTGTVLIEDGAVTGDKVEAQSVAAKVGQFVKVQATNVEVTGELAARVVNAMDTTTRNLVVTESAILQHTTLLGTTVADELNVRKLIRGRDAILDGTLDVAQLNVTGEMSAQIARFMDAEARKLIVTEDAILNRATVVEGLVTSELISKKANIGDLAARMITSGLLQTTTTANRGVKIDNAGIRAWDDTGQRTIRLNGSDNLMQGTFQTGTTGSRIKINAVNTTAFMDLYGNSGGLDHGTIYYDAAVPGKTDAALTLTAIKDYSANPENPSFRLFPTRGTFAFQGRWASETDPIKFMVIRNDAGLPANAYNTFKIAYSTPFPTKSAIRFPLLSIESENGADILATIVAQTEKDITINAINKSGGKASGRIIIKLVTFNTDNTQA